jgi:hypothetical protein
VRNIINIKHRLTKEPLNIFYIDIEPVANNKDIYAIKAIQKKLFNSNLPNQPNNTFHSVCDVNTMVTRGNILAGHTTALNAKAPTAVRRVQNFVHTQQSAPYAEGRTLQTIRDVKNIETCSEDTTPTDWPH